MVKWVVHRVKRLVRRCRRIRFFRGGHGLPQNGDRVAGVDRGRRGLFRASAPLIGFLEAVEGGCWGAGGGAFIAERLGGQGRQMGFGGSGRGDQDIAELGGRRQLEFFAVQDSGEGRGGGGGGITGVLQEGGRGPLDMTVPGHEVGEGYRCDREVALGHQVRHGADVRDVREDAERGRRRDLLAFSCKILQTGAQNNAVHQLQNHKNFN